MFGGKKTSGKPKEIVEDRAIHILLSKAVEYVRTRSNVVESE